MTIDSVIDYWQRQNHTESGIWVHPEDEVLLSTEDHSFNLDYPASTFVGDILNAPVIILGANGGYDSVVTPKEFEDEDSIENYLARILSPSTADWSAVSPYYESVNYRSLLFSGTAVLVNACAYRSPKISSEPENKKIIEKLRSVAFIRSWLAESVLPLVRSGERIVVANRYGLWNLPGEMRQTEGVIFDPAPISAHLAKSTLSAIQKGLE